MLYPSVCPFLCLSRPQTRHNPRNMVRPCLNCAFDLFIDSTSFVPATLQPQVEDFQNENRKLGSGCECAIHTLQSIFQTPVVQVNATTFQDRRENMYPFFRRVDSSREAALIFIAFQPWGPELNSPRNGNILNHEQHRYVSSPSQTDPPSLLG